MSNQSPALVESNTADREETKGDDRPPIEAMNPASKLVYVVLEREGPLSTSELAEQTRLKPDTVRRRAARLNGVGHVRSRPNLRNPSENVHELRTSETRGGCNG
ncbi:hypothetical protein [Natronorubrum sp. FCH18a]|uniref:hypothetical protein n=1 Tax=Natronorubrum sp. FCH18a TaxID=3447018 RepID=UPI003F50E48E